MCILWTHLPHTFPKPQVLTYIVRHVNLEYDMHMPLGQEAEADITFVGHEAEVGPRAHVNLNGLAERVPDPRPLADGGLAAFIGVAANWRDGGFKFDVNDDTNWLVKPQRAVLVAIISGSLADCYLNDVERTWVSYEHINTAHVANALPRSEEFCKQIRMHLMYNLSIAVCKPKSTSAMESCIRIRVLNDSGCTQV